jgi:uncharacterized protein (UPF0332 family)
MISDENDRKVLIDYRLNQAIESLETVHFLIINNQFILAVNRVYYGMFYALSALALKHEFQTSKHAQLIGWFNKEFVSTKKVNQDTGWALKKAYGNRTKGDYDLFISFEKEEVDLMLHELKNFISEIETLLSNQ